MLVNSIRTLLLAIFLREKMFFGYDGIAGGGAGAAVGEGPATQGSIRFGNRVIRSSLWEWDQCRLFSSTG